MKRELAFALEARSQILDTVGKTRSNRVPSFDSNGSRTPKRVKRATLDDPFLVKCSLAEIEQSGLKIACSKEGSKDQCLAIANTDKVLVKNLEKTGIEAERRDIVLGLASGSVERIRKNNVNVMIVDSPVMVDCSADEIEEAGLQRNVGNGIKEDLKSHFVNSDNVGNSLLKGLETPVQLEGREVVYGSMGRLVKVNGRAEEVDEMEAEECLQKKEKVEANGKLKVLAEFPRRRFTRSLLKSGKDLEDLSKMENGKTVVEEVDNLVGAIRVENPEVVANTHQKSVDQEGCVGVNLMGTPKKKLEMDVSKKFVINKIPKTVKELLKTGLLEGYPVYYNGGKEGPVIHGRIKGLGILCSCGLCKGGRVVAPSHFEIHAIKSYKRAAEKICFENGKSFIEILHICRRAKLNTLLVTIQKAIGPLPEKQLAACTNCKGPFPTAIVANVEPLCGSCMQNLLSPRNPVRKAGQTSRSSKSSSASKSGALVLTRLRSRNGGTTRPEKEFFTQKYCRRTQMAEVSPKNACDKKKGPVPEDAVLTPKPSLRPSREITKRSGKSIQTPKLSKVPLPAGSSQKKAGKITTKDFQRHRAVFDKLSDGTELAYFAHGEQLLNGYKKGTGIFCYCCNNVVSASQFEAHAGYATHKKPYEYIYTSDGVSLHDLAVSICKENGRPDKKSDSLCFICAEGDSLLLCDGCPRAFHRECAALTCEPSDKWYCRYCRSLFERGKHVRRNANAIAAGSMRTVKDTDEFTSCHLCSGSDFERSVFGPRTILLCDQCEKEYHISCLKAHNIADLSELPHGTWFCSDPCQKIHTSLQVLLSEGAQKLPSSLLDALLEKNVQQDSVDAGDMRWMLLSGQLLRQDSKKAMIKQLFSQAISVLHEGFGSIMTHGGGRDLIPHIVYGRDLKGSHDYSGMYCAVLLIKDIIVSVAVFRVFGQEIMELPLVATRKGYRGKGYFQALFGCIENFLSFHHVKSIVLPAAEEAEAIWLKLGLKRMSPEQCFAYRKVYWKMVEFNGIVWLEKEVPKFQPADTEQLNTEEAGPSQSQLEPPSVPKFQPGDRDQLNPKEGPSQSQLELQSTLTFQPVDIEQPNPVDAGSSLFQPEAQSSTKFQPANGEQPSTEEAGPISISVGGPE